MRVKAVKGYVGLYEISDTGRIWSLAGGKKELKPSVSCGYARITLRKNKQRFSFQVHRLLCEAFIPNPKNKRCVNHKNGDRQDNRIKNLEWCTHSENQLHAFRILKRRPAFHQKFGAENPCSLPVIQYTENMKRVKTFANVREAGNKVKVHPSNISRAARGVFKMSAGFIWRYV